MNPLSDYLAHNLTAVYFLYGLAFFAMGLTLVIHGGRASQLRFVRAIQPLAGFGILHGAHEWIEMFQQMAALEGRSGPGWVEETFRVLVLAVSFLLLLAFAARLLLPAGAGIRSTLKIVAVAGGVWLMSTFAVAVAWQSSAEQSIAFADVLARYTLGIPGALAGAWALMKQQRAFRDSGMARFGRDLVWCATALSLYGAVGQIFVRTTSLPPSTIINGALFLNWFGIPVQIFRGAMATLLAIYMARALTVIEAENRQRLEEALAGERQIAEEMERLNDVLRSRTHELSLLLELTNLLAAPLALEDSLKAVLGKAIQNLTFPSAGLVSLVKAPRQSPHVTASVGFAPDAADSYLSQAVELGEMCTTSGLIICRHDDGVIYEFSVQDAILRGECRAHPEPAVMISFPLIVRGDQIGSITLSLATQRDRAQLPVDEYELMAAVAQQLALTIENARLRQQAIQRESTLAELLHQVVTVQESERQRIARELHDVTGQSLTAIALGLRGVQTTVRIDPDLAVKQAHQLGSYSTTALTELRQLIADLRPSQLDDLGLVAALQWYVQDFQERYSVKCRFLFNGNRNRRLPPEHETTLFRIVQEALTNVAKHAQATMASVRLDTSPDGLQLVVEDDGRGFEVSRTPSRGQSQGWGLLGIQERAMLLGGECEISSQPGKGTTVRITMPVPEWRSPDNG